MKKVICFVFLLSFALLVNGQNKMLNISTDSKEFRYWNPDTKKFDDSDGKYEYYSLFTFNSDETMFMHTTTDIKSSYFVDKKIFEEACNCYSYDVTSDVGNKYTFFVDLDKNLFKIMSVGHEKPKDDYLIIFTIKKHWKE